MAERVSAHLVLDKHHRVLICRPSQSLIFSGQLSKHIRYCKYCSRQDLAEYELASRLSDTDHNPVAAIKIKICKYPYQLIQGKIRYILTEEPPKFQYHVATVSMPDPVFTTEQRLPSYMRPHLLEHRDKTKEELIKINCKELTATEEWLFSLSKIYWLSSYVKLNTPLYSDFRCCLKGRYRPANYPFQQLTVKTTCNSYMRTFALVNICLFRNYVGEKFIPDIGIFQPIVDMLNSSVMPDLSEHLLALLSLVPDVHRPSDIPLTQLPFSQSNKQLDRTQLLSLLGETESYEFDITDLNYQLKTFHKVWTHILLQNTTNRPVYFEALGLILRAGNEEQPYEADAANKLVCGMIYSLRLINWAELVFRSPTTSFMTANNLYEQALLDKVNRKPISNIYRLGKDLSLISDLKLRSSPVWKDFNQPESLILKTGEELKFSTLQHGIKSWVDTLVSQLADLTMAEFTLDILSAPGERKVGFSEFDTCDAFETYLTKNSKTLDMDVYIEKSDKFLRSLVILMHICCVGAPRGTELFHLTYRNSMQLRTISKEGPVIFIALDYHKSKYKKNEIAPKHKLSTKLYLPWIISELLTRYLAVVRRYICNHAEVCKDYNLYLCCTPKARWGLHGLYKSHKRHTYNSFKVEISVSVWRQILTLILDKFEVLGGSKSKHVLRELHKFLLHSLETAASDYGQSLDKRPFTNEGDSAFSRATAQAYHRLMGFEEIDKKYAIKLSKPEITTLPIVTHKAMPLPPVTVSEEKKLDNEAVLAQYQLRAGLANCAWKSTEQREAYKLSRDGKSFFAILQTNGGKTAIFEFPLFSNEQGFTVIIVPLLSLKIDLIRRLTDHGVNVAAEGDTSLKKPVQVMTTEMVIQKSSYVRSWALDKCLKCLIFDEAHTLISNEDFRSQPHNLLSLGVQTIFLSATMPQDYISKIDEMTKQAFPVIRQFPTSRHNISYKVVKAERRQAASSHLQWICSQFVSSLQTNPTALMLIFVAKIEEADKIEPFLPPGIRPAIFNSKIEDKELVLQNLYKGKYNTVICTTALSLGIDHPNISLVIHWRNIFSLVDFAQATGRAGRAGQPAESIFIKFNYWTKKDQTPDLCAAEAYGTTNECRRDSMAQYLDGRPFTCTMLKGYAKCDVCELQSSPLYDRLKAYPKQYFDTDFQFELVRQRYESTASYYCLRHGDLISNDEKDKPCDDADSYFRNNIFQLLKSGHCAQCGLKEMSDTGVRRHNILKAGQCRYAHAMREALMYCSMTSRGESLQKYHLPQEVVDRIRKANANSKSPSYSGDIRIVRAALQVLCASMFNESLLH